jgi:hypothetical protein
MILKNTPVHLFTNTSTEKKTSTTTSIFPKTFNYMEHLLKPPLGIVDTFLKKNSNLVTLKTFALLQGVFLVVSLLEVLHIFSCPISKVGKRFDRPVAFSS